MKFTKIYLFLLVVLSGLTILWLFASRQQETPSTINRTQRVAISPTSAKTGRISIDLRVLSGQGIKTGQKTQIDIYGDAGKAEVAAYDVFFQFVPVGTSSAKINLVSAESLDSRFDVFPTEKDGLVILTGVKKLEALSAAFNGEKIAQFTVLPTGSGSMKMNLVTGDQHMKARSRMMDIHARDILEGTGLSVSQQGE